MRLIILAILFLGCTPALAAPYYVRCGWAGPEPDEWMLKIDPDAQEVAVVPASRGPVEAQFHESYIVLHTTRETDFDITRWYVDSECEALEVAAAHSDTSPNEHNPTLADQCSQVVGSFTTLSSRTVLRINRFTGAFNIIDFAEHQGHTYRMRRVAGQCHKVKQQF